MTSAMTLVHLTLLPLVLVATVSGLREQELQCEPIKIEQVTYLPTFYSVIQLGCPQSGGCK